MTPSATCGRCEGCGKIAEESGEPWTAWANLPPGSDLAVKMGIVKPTECPDCGGSGFQPAPARTHDCASTAHDERGCLGCLAESPGEYHTPPPPAQTIAGVPYRTDPSVPPGEIRFEKTVGSAPAPKRQHRDDDTTAMKEPRIHGSLIPNPLGVDAPTSTGEEVVLHRECYAEYVGPWYICQRLDFCSGFRYEHAVATIRRTK